MKGIEGFFSEAEGRWYRRFARGLRGGVFVEVGSWKGRSTSFIGPVCNAQGTRLVCVDHWESEDVEQIFRANMNALGIDCEVLRARSVDAAAAFGPKSVDRVFLDASHDGASVAADLAAWSACLRDGGILAGHDYMREHHPDLCDAVDAFARARGLRVGRGPRDVFWLEPP
ncbi:hypothetical protein BH09MYX1_BH09MYX1_50570 [soil metagenome]